MTDPIAQANSAQNASPIVDENDAMRAALIKWRAENQSDIIGMGLVLPAYFMAGWGAGRQYSANRMSPPLTISEEELEKAIKAYDQEHERWIIRTNKASRSTYEVCRFDDTGLAGSFSEIHGFGSVEDSQDYKTRERAWRSMRAALQSIGVQVEGYER